MGCTVETPKPKRRRKSLPTARPYGELSEEAKARARDCWREKGWTWDQWDSGELTDLFAEVLLEEYGIEVATRTERLSGGKTIQRPDISWSLSYCQGDGVSFTAHPDLEAMAKKNEAIREVMQTVELLEAAGGWEYSPEWSVSIDANGGHAECHAYHRANHDEQRVLDELCVAIEAELDQVHKQACRRLEKLGYAEIEYRDSYEYLEDVLTANDHYLFTEEGEFDS
ncbi:MAG: hypothetical protein WBL72_11735 [Thermoguttaceae bacterium]